MGNYDIIDIKSLVMGYDFTDIERLMDYGFSGKFITLYKHYGFKPTDIEQKKRQVHLQMRKELQHA